MKIRVAAAQIKPRKGDYDCNMHRVGDVFEQLELDAPQTDVVVFPETSLSGYFLEGGVRDAARSRDQLFDDLLSTYRSRVKRPGAALDVCIGFYELGDGKYYNSAIYCTVTSANVPSGDQTPPHLTSPAAGRGTENCYPHLTSPNRTHPHLTSPTLHPLVALQRVETTGEGLTAAIHHVHRKFFLPTYGVFDEKRFVSRGRSVAAFNTRFGKAAVLICEDAWHSITATLAALKGAQIIFIVSASPGREFCGQHIGNVARWNVLLPGIADEHNVWLVYAGLVGFEGGKGFTGSSQIIDPWGNSLVQGSSTEECIITGTIDTDDVAAARAASPLLADLEAALGDITMELDQIARNPYLPNRTAGADEL